jgi:hypothetical protein
MPTVLTQDQARNRLVEMRPIVKAAFPLLAA